MNSSIQTIFLLLCCLNLERKDKNGVVKLPNSSDLLCLPLRFRNHKKKENGHCTSLIFYLLLTYKSDLVLHAQLSNWGGEISQKKKNKKTLSLLMFVCDSRTSIGFVRDFVTFRREGFPFLFLSWTKRHGCRRCVIFLNCKSSVDISPLSVIPIGKKLTKKRDFVRASRHAQNLSKTPTKSSRASSCQLKSTSFKERVDRKADIFVFKNIYIIKLDRETL